MPTYNGERYVAEAIESLLSQDHANLEILVSDNASTDATWSIVQSYSERDPRIRVVRQERNVGAPANFNFVFRNTRATYFMWASDDDRWHPNYGFALGNLGVRPD